MVHGQVEMLIGMDLQEDHLLLALECLSPFQRDDIIR